MKWMPIDTAPGGGERVEFFVPKPNWAADYAIVSGFGKPGSSPSVTLDVGKLGRDQHPTHWRPLSHPPVRSSQVGGP